MSQLFPTQPNIAPDPWADLTPTAALAVLARHARLNCCAGGQEAEAVEVLAAERAVNYGEGEELPAISQQSWHRSRFTLNVEDTCTCRHIRAAHSDDLGPCLVQARWQDASKPVSKSKPCPCEGFESVKAS
jgi:hypothetical protein